MNIDRTHLDASLARNSTRTLSAAFRDVSAALMVEPGLFHWVESVWARNPQPISAEVWVFSPDFMSILTVKHRWRGLVPPGGRVEDSETPREAAARELSEETGLNLHLEATPAHASARSFSTAWSPTLSLAYWAVASPTALLRAEPGQPAGWVAVRDDWLTFYGADGELVRRLARHLRSSPGPVHSKLS